MVTIVIKEVGPGLASFQREINTLQDLIINEIPLMAEQAAEHMKTVIKAKKKRKGEGKDNLERNILVQVLSRTNDFVDVGIGNIALLDRFAPYWYMMNYGRIVTSNDKPKHFVPGFFDAGIYKYSPGNREGFMMPSGLAAGVVIQPMGYIEEGSKFLETAILLRIAKDLK